MVTAPGLCDGPNASSRVKALALQPYSQKEADAGVGLGTDHGARQAARDQERATAMAVDIESLTVSGKDVVT